MNGDYLGWQIPSSETSVSPVEKPFDQQRLSEYQNRVSEWIGGQGILFQLRYAKTVGSRSLVKNLGSLIVRFLIIAVLLAGIGYFLLKRHFSSDGYQENITNQLSAALGAMTVEAKGFSRKQGSGSFRDLEVEGGETSFFFNAKFDNLSAPFAYLTGVTEGWAPDTVKISKANVSLKAGGTEEEMSAAFSRVIESLAGDGISLIRIKDFSCDWGYSKLTHGRIENTDFRGILENGRWKVTMKGGKLWQNWLYGFSIDEAELLIDEDGIVFDSLSVSLGSGRLDLAGRISGPIETPEFDLKGEFSSLPVEKLIMVDGVNTREYIEGTISGQLAIGGSTNRRIKISGEAALAEVDMITIRERWSLLKAISIIDNERTYRRISFKEGSFKFSTEGGGLEVSEINLLAKDTAKLAGGFVTKLPSQEEAAERLGISLTDGFSSDYTDKSSAQKLEDDRMSLRNAAGGGGRVDDISLDESTLRGLSNRDKEQLSAKELEGLRLQEEMKIHRINGKLRLAVPKAAFQNNQNLSVLYPADTEGWRWILMDLDTTFTDISEEANEIILDQSRARNIEGLESN